MKRLFIVLLALAVVVSLVPVATAEDRLSISGSMRVRAWDRENYTDFNDNNTADEFSWWDQRFRVGATIKATDYVSGHLRWDFSEAVWGAANWDGSRYDPSTSGEDIQVDRAYLQIKQDMYTLQAGQLFQGTGFNYIVLDGNNTGINLTLNLPVSVTLLYSKYSENGSNTDIGATEDQDLYAVQAKYAAEAFTVGAFYATLKDHTPTDNSPNAFGVFGKTAFGPVNVQAELDIFGGDQSATVEYTGTQFFLDGTMMFGTTLVGVNFVYAAAQSTDGTEAQATSVDNWNDWNPMCYVYGSFLSSEFDPTPGGEIFDFTGDGAGVTGMSIYAKFAAMEKLAIYAQLGYLVPEDDAVSKGNSDLDSATIINLTADYTLVPNATLGIMYSTTMVDMQTAGTKDDSASTIMSRLQISF